MQNVKQTQRSSRLELVLTKRMLLSLFSTGIEIAGPEDSPYHGGSFRIDIHIPDR